MEPEVSLPHSQEPATRPYSDQSNPVHTTIPLSEYLFEYYPFICAESSKRSLLFRFPHKALYTPLLSPIRATCPTHHILLDLITRIIFVDEYGSLIYSSGSFLHFPFTSSLLSPTDNLLSTLFSNTLSLRSFLNVSDHVLHPYKRASKIIVMYILIFIFVESKLEDKRFCTE